MDYFDRFLSSVDGYISTTMGGPDTETIPPATTTGQTPGTSMFGGVSNQALWIGGAVVAGVLLLALRK